MQPSYRKYQAFRGHLLIQLLKWFSTYLQNLPEEYFKLPLGQQFTKAMILNGGEGAHFGASESWEYGGVCHNSPHMSGYNSLIPC